MISTPWLERFRERWLGFLVLEPLNLGVTHMTPLTLVDLTADPVQAYVAAAYTCGCRGVHFYDVSIGQPYSPASIRLTTCGADHARGFLRHAPEVADWSLRWAGSQLSGGRLSSAWQMNAREAVLEETADEYMREFERAHAERWRQHVTDERRDRAQDRRTKEA